MNKKIRIHILGVLVLVFGLGGRAVASAGGQDEKLEIKPEQEKDFRIGAKFVCAVAKVFTSTTKNNPGAQELQNGYAKIQGKWTLPSRMFSFLAEPIRPSKVKVRAGVGVDLGQAASSGGYGDQCNEAMPLIKSGMTTVKDFANGGSLEDANKSIAALGEKLKSFEKKAEDKDALKIEQFKARKIEFFTNGEGGYIAAKYVQEHPEKRVPTREELVEYKKQKQEYYQNTATPIKDLLFEIRQEEADKLWAQVKSLQWVSPMLSYVRKNFIFGLSTYWSKDKMPTALGHYRPSEVKLGGEITRDKQKNGVGAEYVGKVGVKFDDEMWSPAAKEYAPVQMYAKAKFVTTEIVDPRSVWRWNWESVSNWWNGKNHGYAKSGVEVGAKFDGRILNKVLAQEYAKKAQKFGPEIKVSAKYAGDQGLLARATIQLKKLWSWRLTPQCGVQGSSKDGLSFLFNLSSDDGKPVITKEEMGARAEFVGDIYKIANGKTIHFD